MELSKLDEFRSHLLLDFDDLKDPNKLMRIPICLCIDTSTKMGENSSALEKEIKKLMRDIYSDEFLNSSVELGIYTFASKTKCLRDISTIKEIEWAKLTLSFDEKCQNPDLASCLNECMKAIECRKQGYRIQRLNAHPPHIIILGAATPRTDENWENVVNQVKEKQDSLSIIPIVIGNEKVNEYKFLSIDGAVYRGLITNLADILKTVKNSMRKLSESSASIYNRLNSMVKAWEDYL